jgi:linoleoyl-CoA desaturase
MHVFYPKESDDFYEVLTKRVNDFFTTSNKSKFANSFFYVKAFLLISMYLLCYFVLLFSEKSILAQLGMIFMGPLAILIGINIAHDAAHETISSKKWVNKLFLFLFDLLGANSYMWQKRHVYSHHTFPNILNQDADLKQNPLVRIFPNDTLRKAHRFQFIYAPFLYLLYTINWLFFRDFKDFTEKKIGSLTIQGHAVKEWFKLALFKLFYISYIIVIPLLFSDLSLGQFIVAFIGMNFAASIMITLALIPSHVAENSLFLLPNEQGEMPHPWSHHQVLSVIDFATGNPFLNFFFGGFNHHVSHHLFPHISHVHCVHITPIIKQTALEFNLPYNHESSFINAYVSHFKLLKNNGKKQTLILN